MTVSPRGILLSWIERAGTRATLKFAERTPSGWSPATTAAAGDDWFVNWADVPSVLRLDDGTLAAHWLQKSGAETYAYDVRLAHSKDDGRTWSASFTPHHDGTKREHGFASLFQMPGAGLGLIWLDGRAMGSAEGHDAHGATEGAMSVRYGTFDTAWKQTNEMPVDLRVCECCPTTAAMTSEGPVVAYRNRTDDEIRDIYVSRLENGKWTEGKPVHDDHWKIAACPVNGPMLSARGRGVVLAWFTVKDDVGHAYAAFSADAGRTFGTPIRLDDDERARAGRCRAAARRVGAGHVDRVRRAEVVVLDAPLGAVRPHLADDRCHRHLWSQSERLSTHRVRSKRSRVRLDGESGGSVRRENGGSKAAGRDGFSPIDHTRRPVGSLGGRRVGRTPASHTVMTGRIVICATGQSPTSTIGTMGMSAL